MKKIAIAMIFFILVAFGCVATQPSVTSPPAPYTSWDKGIKSLVYNGLTYKLEGGRVGKGVIQGERYRLNENTYIDVIYFDKVVWTYVIMNDFTAYKAKKCDPINFSLVDTDCDGIPDKRILACTSIGPWPDC